MCQSHLKMSLVRKLGRHTGSHSRGSRSVPLKVHTQTDTVHTVLLLPCIFGHPPSPPRSSPRFWSWFPWCGQWWKFWCRTGPRPGGSPRGVWRRPPLPPSWAWRWHLGEAGRKQSLRSPSSPSTSPARGRGRKGSAAAPRGEAAAPGRAGRLCPRTGPPALTGEEQSAPCPPPRSPSRARSLPRAAAPSPPGAPGIALLRLPGAPSIGSLPQPARRPELTQRFEELVEILAAPHLPGAGEVRHGGAGGGDAMLLALRLGHRVSGADRGGGGERGSHPPAPGPSPGSSARRQAAVPPPSLPSVRPCSPPSIHHSLLRGPPGAARLPLVQPLRWAPRTRWQSPEAAGGRRRETQVRGVSGLTAHRSQPRWAEARKHTITRCARAVGAQPAHPCQLRSPGWAHPQQR